MWYALNEPWDKASTSLPSSSWILQVPTNPIRIKWYHTDDVPTNPPQLFNGHFWRLSTIHRTGDTSFTIEGTKVRLTGELLNVIFEQYAFCRHVITECWVISHYFLQILHKLLISCKYWTNFSQHWSGCSNSPLRRLCRVHGHWG